MNRILFLMMVIFVAIIGQSFYQNSPQPGDLTAGKNVYTIYCQSCHMEDGNGVEGAFPSLVKTGNLNDKNKMVKIILQGMRGPIVVKGIQYNAEMAAINLTDQETADVINYIRNAWGNKAPFIKASEVQSAKKAEVKGFQAY